MSVVVGEEDLGSLHPWIPSSVAISEMRGIENRGRLQANKKIVVDLLGFMRNFEQNSEN